jgi:hypothetical protein
VLDDLRAMCFSSMPMVSGHEIIPDIDNSELLAGARKLHMIRRHCLPAALTAARHYMLAWHGKSQFNVKDSPQISTAMPFLDNGCWRMRWLVSSNIPFPRVWGLAPLRTVWSREFTC